MTLADIVALVMLAALILYTLTGGADFGGGVWDLVAFGPRARDQRRLIEKVISPIWEANHVWLILVVVMLFTGFPTAFAIATTALHIPLTLMLIGIVLRGSAFVFRHYGPPDRDVQKRFGRVFAIASTFTPVLLGMTIGAITGGEIHADGGTVTSGFLAGWLGAFPLLLGLFTLSLFAFLAAVYLTGETDDAALREDFRWRACVAGVLVALFALASGLAAGPGTLHFSEALLHSWWSWPLQIATGLAAVGAFAALVMRRFQLARVLAAAQVALIIAGWGLAQRPFLIAPDVRIAETAAPEATLRLLLGALGLGALILFPSLFWLYRVFRRADRDRP